MARTRITLDDARALARQRGGRCLSTNYVNNSTRMLWQCESGHKWEAIYNNIYRGKWCPRCRGFYRTIDDMEALAAKRGGHCLSTTFVRMGDNLRWQCAKGHEWEAVPTSVWGGTWCPVCAGRARLSITYAKQMARKRGGVCLSSSYLNSQTKLRWKCAKRHRWEAVASSVRAGSWCPFCVGRGKTLKDMWRLANLHGGSCLSRSFAGMVRKLQWRCAKGHVWRAVPKSIQRGTWCPTCAREQRNTKYSISDFQRIAKQRGGGCHSSEYKGSNSKLCWECSKGHRWQALPLSVKRGHWCPYCQGFHVSLRDMRQLAKQRGGTCLSSKYTNARIKLLWECANGHRWEAVPYSIKIGTWCPKCAPNPTRSIKDMQILATARGGRCLSTEYVNAKAKLVWRCAEGHRWNAAATNIRSGNWCPECSSGLGERICREYFEQLFGKPFPKARPPWLRVGKRCRLELDGYCEELALAFEHQGPHHRGLNIYSSKHYERASKQKEHDRVKRLRCRKNGVVLFRVPEIPTLLKPNDLRVFIRQACRENDVPLPRSFEDTRVDLIKAYAEPRARRELRQISAIAESKGGKCLSRTYKGALEKLLWLCEKGHSWRAKPWDIKVGNWCPHCAGKRFTIHDMRSLAQLKGGQCLSSRYSGTSKKLLWECAKGHQWKAVPSSIKAGTWCPACAPNRRLSLQSMPPVASERGGACVSKTGCNARTMHGSA